jgi:hypothetical protein
MTDFVMSPATPVTFENLEWDLTPPHGAFVLGGTLDIPLFTQAQHFPNGYIQSGIALGRVTATSLLGPYLDTATDGRQVAVGLMRASVPVTRVIGGTNRARLGVAFLIHGVVQLSKLPYTAGNAAAGGFVDAAARADLPLIYWAV